MEPVTIGLLAAAGIGAAGSIWSAMSGSAAADRASERQLQGGREAIAAQQAQFGQTKANLQPFIDVGKQGLSELSRRTLSGEFGRPFTAEMMAADPGLQYRMQQANLALERSASARGRLLSGGTIRNIAELNQSLASQEFGAAYERDRLGKADEFTRLSSLSNTGLTAASALGEVSQGLGSSLSDLYTGMGAVRGSAEITKGQLNQNLIGNLTNVGSSLATQWGSSVTPQSAQPKQSAQVASYPMERSSDPLNWNL